MKGMRHFTLPLSAIYFVLFLPLVHAGYLNSLVPKVDIPRFVAVSYTHLDVYKRQTLNYLSLNLN